MKRTPSSAWRLRTALTTSTTGPQVRLVQYLGVAKTTTKGLRASSAPATDVRYSSRSGTFDVLSRPIGASPSVGVFDGGARSPTSGACGRFFTTTLPTAWILRPPTGSASIQYVPGCFSSRFVTKTASASPGSDAPMPTRSERAVVCAKGGDFRPRATHTFASGRVTRRPWLSTTRNEKRIRPGPKSELPGTIATSSPGARHSDSSVAASGSSCAEEEPPQPAANEQAARHTAAAWRTRRV